MQPKKPARYTNKKKENVIFSHLCNLVMSNLIETKFAA